MITVRDNEEAYNRHKIRPRVLRDVSNIDTTTTIFGAKILQRAEQAGYKAVMMTVDAPMLGRRLNEYRNAFGLPEGMGYPNVAPGMDMRNLVDQGLDLTYEDGMNWEQALGWIRENTKLDVWLKGVYTAEDVALAIEHGVDGVLISNHGGRQLDGVPATLEP
ncbi:Oxidase FUB9 [Colletotrichum aenigma]|uniref:Oxidase FUB9 n=1 Tax=Colletotrichum aenigma TaxID=1215731 RepID=UPI001872531F|nr:Oxidase FUB9 [Colletotrichum aenigma]KAF5512943.1 Oxidase FUB9 [Colletotrichum aenigma]